MPHDKPADTAHPADNAPSTQGMGITPAEPPGKPKDKPGERSRLKLWLALAAALLVPLGLGIWLYLDLNRTPEAPPTAKAPEPAKRDYMTRIPGPPPAEPVQPAPPAAPPESSAAAPPAPESPTGHEVIQADFVTDLAHYVASRYHPAGTRDNTGKHGMSTLTFKSLNMHYGMELTGLRHEDRDLEAAREEIFSALMHPIVLRLVFDLYADDFTAALADAAGTQARDFATGSGYASKALSEAQRAELLRLTAAQSRDMGAVFEAFARRPELATGVVRYFDAARRVNEAYAAFADAQAAGAAEATLEAVAETIKQSIKERERLKEIVLAGLRGKGNALSDGQILDIATWITRRIQGHAGRINAVGAIASLSRELADRLDRAALTQ